MPIMPPNEPGTEPEPRTAIEEVFGRLESPLMSYAFRLTGNFNVAEDIVQEAFMRLHENFSEVRDARRWLYRTTHNLALNHRRQAGKIFPLQQPGSDETSDPPEAADPLPLPDEQIARWEGIGLVRLILESLDARSRELIALKFEQDLSYKEISARMGLTVGNVGYLLHHALKRVGDELARNGLVR